MCQQKPKSIFLGHKRTGLIIHHSLDSNSMDVKENNLNAIDLVNTLIDDIGTDNLPEVIANVTLFNTCETLMDLRLRLQDIQAQFHLQDVQDAQLRHQHPPQPQQPQEPPQGTCMLAHENPWVDRIQSWGGGYARDDTHVSQLKSFLAHLNQTIEC